MVRVLARAALLMAPNSVAWTSVSIAPLISLLPVVQLAYFQACLAYRAGHAYHGLPGGWCLVSPFDPCCPMHGLACSDLTMVPTQVHAHTIVYCDRRCNKNCLLLNAAVPFVPCELRFAVCMHACMPRTV